MQTVVDASQSTTPTRTSLRQYFIVYVVFFAVIFLLKLLLRDFSLFLRVSHLFFLVGGLFGLGINILDRLVYAYVTKPDDHFSLQVQSMVKQKQFVHLLLFLADDKDANKHLSTNNILFLGVWVVLALFVLTSTLSGFGRGVVLGIGLVLSYDLIVDLRQLNYLKKRLFWPVNREMTDTETKTVVYFFLGAFVFLSLLAI